MFLITDIIREHGRHWFRRWRRATNLRSRWIRWLEERDVERARVEREVFTAIADEGWIIGCDDELRAFFAYNPRCGCRSSISYIQIELRRAFRRPAQSSIGSTRCGATDTTTSPRTRAFAGWSTNESIFAADNPHGVTNIRGTPAMRETERLFALAANDADATVPAHLKFALAQVREADPRIGYQWTSAVARSELSTVDAADFELAGLVRRHDVFGANWTLTDAGHAVLVMFAVASVNKLGRAMGRFDLCTDRITDPGFLLSDNNDSNDGGRQ